MNEVSQKPRWGSGYPLRLRILRPGFNSQPGRLLIRLNPNTFVPHAFGIYTYKNIDESMQDIGIHKYAQKMESVKILVIKSSSSEFL